MPNETSNPYGHPWKDIADNAKPGTGVNGMGTRKWPSAHSASAQTSQELLTKTSHLGWIPSGRLEVQRLQFSFCALSHLGFIKRGMYRLSIQCFNMLKRMILAAKSSPQKLRNILVEIIPLLST